MTATTHHSFCRICEALCGLQVTVDDGRITAIAPDPDHVATAGFGCVKGVKQHHLYDSPDRLRTPLRRVGDRYEPASWEEALAAIGGQVRALRSAHGADSIALYVGTAAGFGVLHPIFANGFMAGLGSRSLYATATQDCANKFAVSTEMYGFPFTLPHPDVDRVSCLVIVGANPVVSKWSFLQVSNPDERLRAIARRGGRVIVVDPRFTETARAATDYLAIRPGTDVFFYLAFLSEVLRRGAVDQAVVDAHATGFETLAAIAAPWTPERCAEVTRIPAPALRGIVDAYLAAEGAALYSSTGVNMGGAGSLAYWLQEAINLVTGNLDRPGGLLVGKGIFDFPAFAKRRGLLVSEERSRVGGFKKVNDAFPGGVLADEILTPGEGQVRALFVTGGNPLITMPNAGRLRGALRRLELLVSIDLFLNETASEAHWVLPATAPFQRPDLPFVFPLFLGLQSRPYLQATRAILEPDGLQRDEASLYVALAKACGVSLYGSAVLQKGLEAAMAWDAWRHPERPARVPQEALLDLVLRLSRQPSLASLLAAPHGVARAPATGGDFLGARVLTADGRVHLAPEPLVEAAADLERAFERERGQAGALKLITKRHVKTHNSWTHNAEAFVGGRDDRNRLYMHPDDAAARGLADGDLVDVSTDTATVRLPLALLDTLMPGAVALPHGWGHQHAKGLSVASRTAGVNVNLLAADGPDRIERVSGMAHLTGFVVEVRKSASDQDPSSWSGLPG